MSGRPTKNLAGQVTAEKILDAAERLVATDGMDVPLRRIALAAGQRNNSAVAYHFGSRQGLMDAVWERRTRRVNAERAAMMEAIVNDGRLDDMRALLEAHVLPLTHEIGANLPSYWARFNEATLARMPLAFLQAFDADLARWVDQDVPLRTLADLFLVMRKHVAGGVEPAAGLRVALMVRFVIGSLASWERDQELGRVNARSLDAFARGLVDASHEMLVRPNGQLALAADLMSG